ncbi:hypothetical protein PAMP_007316 [Pampus punctatissimus]
MCRRHVSYTHQLRVMEDIRPCLVNVEMWKSPVAAAEQDAAAVVQVQYSMICCRDLAAEN